MTCANMFFPLENWWLPANWRWKMCLQKLNSHVKNCNYFFRLSDNIFHMLVLLTWEIYISNLDTHIYINKLHSFENILYSYKNADSGHKSFFFAKSMKHVKRNLIFICPLKWFKRVFHLAQHCNFMDFCCKNWAKKDIKEERKLILSSVIFMSFHISKIYHKMLWLYKNWIRFHTFATGK